MQKVFVLDLNNKPLLPCSNARGRILLKKGKAELFCNNPFTIKLTKDDKTMENTTQEVYNSEVKNGYYKDIPEFNEEFKQTLVQTFAGQILKNIWLEQGEIQSYEKDADMPALFVSEDGERFQSEIKGNRVYPPEFILTGKASSPEGAIFALKENENFITTMLLLKSLTAYAKCSSKDRVRKENFNDRITILPKRIDKENLNQIQYTIERNKNIVDKYLINSTAIKNLDLKDIFNPVTSKDLLSMGYLGDINGIILLKFYADPLYLIKTKISNKLDIDDNVIIAVVEGRFLGIRAVRTFGFLENKEDKDYIAFCLESIAILNPLGIAGGFSEIFLEKKIKLNSFYMDLM